MPLRWGDTQPRHIDVSRRLGIVGQLVYRVRRRGFFTAKRRAYFNTLTR